MANVVEFETESGETVYEKLRELYKPEVVKLLFIGESPPQGGNFFYRCNSHLFRNTKEAFENAGLEFSLESFKKFGCWLYDVCEVPVNGMPAEQRRKTIQQGLPKALEVIDSLNPANIVVVKKGDMEKIVFRAICDKHNYKENETAFNLPFPSHGHQPIYREGLTEIIKRLT